METEEQPHHLGGIYNYFQGATINNLVINGNMNKTATDHYDNTQKTNSNTSVTDDQIAQAITAINGNQKPLNSKQKWAAVHWCLRWYCNFPPNVKDFCERINELPLGKLAYECDYNNIRRLSSMSFMNENARYIDKIKPSNSEKEFFMQCREVVLALVEELGKAVLPQVKI